MSLKDKIKENLNKAKETLYKGVAKVEQQIETREGVVGGLADIVEGAVDKAKEINQSVQEKGGYTKIAKDTLDKAVDKVEGLYHGVDEKLFTDGKFDTEKAKQLAKDGSSLAKMYGTKASQVIVDLSKNVGDKVSSNYRELVPTKEERETTYAGIGTKYKGILLRPNLEKCLTFYAIADAAIPKEVEYRDNILEDIKASASVDAAELNIFYRYTDDSKTIDSKSIVVRKYLRDYMYC